MSQPRPFPLVPQRRFAGARFGERRSPRRGPGDEVAGTRPYRPGDRRTWIDWRASARLSAAHGDDEFVVREFFADQAPRVAVVVDRRSRMGLYGDPLPWLDKPAAVSSVVELIAASTAAERGDLAYVEHRAGRSLWLASRAPADVVDALRRHPASGGFDGAPRSLEAALESLVRHSSGFPMGTFVFVVSDFIDPVPPRAWARLRSLRWDVTPVIVQDPTWEQSFPEIGGVLVEVHDPATGVAEELLLSSREARARSASNEQRHADADSAFRRFGFDPVTIGTSDPASIRETFGRWAGRRRRLRRRSA